MVGLRLSGGGWQEAQTSKEGGVGCCDLGDDLRKYRMALMAGGSWPLGRQAVTIAENSAMNPAARALAALLSNRSIEVNEAGEALDTTSRKR